MEETPLVANYLIHFTETATTKLALSQNAKLRNSLTNACINFRHYSAANANKTLFTLFYGEKSMHEEILKRLFKTAAQSPLEDNFKEPEQNIPSFNQEEFQVLAKELLYQYSAAHPDFLVVKAHCHDYQKELDNLKSSMAAHPILLYRAVEMCKSVCHVEHIVTYGVKLLLSRCSFHQSRGLEAIGHNFQHRVLLLPYAREIGLLLEAMHKAKDCRNSVSPFAIWLNQHEENEFRLAVNTDKLPQYLLLREFENFLNGSSELICTLPRSKDLGHCLNTFKNSLNILLEKTEYLHFAEVLVALLYAKRFYQEAQDEFSLGDPESLSNLSKSIKQLECAKNTYNSTLDVFINSCK